MRLGEFWLDVLTPGCFKIDGGAIFGVVPKVMWNPLLRADEENQIILNLNCLLIRTPHVNILVDTGIRQNISEKIASFYQISLSSTLADLLKEKGLSCNDIDFVIFTHLHFDHAGGAVNEKGGLVFPCARHVIQKKEWEEAFSPNRRAVYSYHRQDLNVLKEKANLMLIDGEVEILQGVKVLLTGGHSPGHQIISLDSEGKKAFVLGDLVPTACHVKLLWIASIDHQPDQVAREKQKLFDTNENYLAFFSHGHQAGRIIKEEKDYRFLPVEEE